MNTTSDSIPENQRIKHEIDMLDEAMAGENPPPALIMAARYLICEHDRDELPDRVALCAFSNVSNWAAAVSEYLAEKAVEDGA